jgi:hypothetical protein
MGRPRLFAEAMTAAERQRRRRERKRQEEVRRSGYQAPARPVTKAAPAVTKPSWGAPSAWTFDPAAMIG